MPETLRHITASMMLRRAERASSALKKPGEGTKHDSTLQAMDQRKLIVTGAQPAKPISSSERSTWFGY